MKIDEQENNEDHLAHAYYRVIKQVDAVALLFMTLLLVITEQLSTATVLQCSFDAAFEIRKSAP